MREYYSINKLVNDTLLYIHYDKGYYFKANIHGACCFTQEHATNFIRDIFNNEPSVTMMRFHMPPTCKRTQVTKQDLYTWKSKVTKSQKRKQQRKRAQMRETAQGPDDECVAPNTFLN